MHGVVFAFKMLTYIMNLGMAVVARRYAVVCTRIDDLVEFKLPILTACLRKAGLQKSPAAAAAKIVGLVGGHINKIFFSHDRFDHKPQIVSHWIAKSFANQLAGVLNRKLDFQVLVPVGIDLQLAFTNPLGIILDDALDFKVKRNVEFFQSGPDCKQFVPSFRIEPDLTAQILHSFGLDLHNMFPGLIVT
jgi:hypothetical protein